MKLNRRPDAADEKGVDASRVTVEDEPTLAPRLAEALAPPVPGRLIRAFAPVVPGIRSTRNQIVSHADYWRVQTEAALERDEAGPLLVVLGDSLSQAVGSSDVETSWVHQLARYEAQQRRLRPAPIVNLSRSGATIDDVLHTQLPALRELGRPIRLLTCTVGSNDLARGRSYSKVEAAMHSLMSRLPADALLATLPAKGSLFAKRLNRTIRDEAPRSGLFVADVDAHLPGWRGRSAGDRFHPNDRGYEAWFSAFTEAVPPQRVRGKGPGPNPTPAR